MSGQPALLLLVGAEGGQREAGQRVHADAEADGQPAAAELLEHLQVDLVGLGRSPVLLLVGQPEQPGAAEGAEHLTRELPRCSASAARGASSASARVRARSSSSSASVLGRLRTTGGMAPPGRRAWPEPTGAQPPCSAPACASAASGRRRALPRRRSGRLARPERPRRLAGAPLSAMANCTHLCHWSLVARAPRWPSPVAFRSLACARLLSCALSPAAGRSSRPPRGDHAAGDTEGCSWPACGHRCRHPSSARPQTAARHPSARTSACSISAWIPVSSCARPVGMPGTASGTSPQPVACPCAPSSTSSAAADGSPPPRWTRCSRHAGLDLTLCERSPDPLPAAVVAHLSLSTTVRLHRHLGGGQVVEEGPLLWRELLQWRGMRSSCSSTGRTRWASGHRACRRSPERRSACSARGVRAPAPPCRPFTCVSSLLEQHHTGGAAAWSSLCGWGPRHRAAARRAAARPPLC
jgi:hypothetical protein